MTSGEDTAEGTLLAFPSSQEQADGRRMGRRQPGA